MKRKDRRTAKRPDARSAAEETRSLPTWAPYALFGLLALALFREFIVSGDMLFGTDVVALGYFARHLYAQLIGEGIFPQWNPYIFGGLPFVDAMHGDIFYPTTVLKFILPVHRAMGWKIVLHVFLAGAVTYGWLRHLRLGRYVSLFGGVTYMLAPVLVSLVYPGHDGKLFVTALTPLALWATDWAVTRGRAWRFGAVAGVVALLIFTAHMQLAYFATWAMGGLAIFRLAQLRKTGLSVGAVGGRLGMLLVAGVVGALAIGAVQIWTPARYLTTYSQRVEKTTGAEAESGYAYSSTWSLHWEEAFSLAVPEFIGANLQTDRGRTDTYWGRNPFKLNHEYAGLLPLLLLPVAFLTRRRRGEVWLFTGLAVGSLVYGLGASTPLFRLFYWLLPGVKLFRAPSSIMFIFAISIVTAAAIGVDALGERSAGEGGRKERDETGEARSRVTLYLWSAAGLFLVLALLGAAGVFTDIWTSTIYRGIGPSKLAALENNLPNIRRGLWLTFLLTAAVAGAWTLRARGTLKEPIWILALVVLSIVDLWRVDAPFIRVIQPEAIFPRDDTVEFLLGRQRAEPPFRVFTFQNAPYQPNHFAFFGLEEMTGHHGNELGRYRELVQGERFVNHAFRVLRLLNVRYLVSGRPLQSPGLRQVFQGRRSLVYEVEGALPRAYLVADADRSAGDGSALDRLLADDFDPAGAALLAEPPPELDPTARGSVEWVERGVNRATLRVRTSGSALLIVSDNYYPAWRASVDGEPTTVLRANHTLRGVPIPPGTHEVELDYSSGLFRASLWTTLISTLGLALLVGGSLLARRSGRAAEAGRDDRPA